ncbi:MAG: TolC family protein [Gemmatimonadales bacterium]
MVRLRLAAFGALLAAAPLAAQEPLTLDRAIAMAQAAGFDAHAAEAARDASRYRDRAFYSRQLPRLSLSGTVPSYNRSIIPVLQPDGSTSFRAQDQISTDLTATLSQQLPLTGGDFFVSSSLSRLAVTGQGSVHTWSSAPVQFGLRQPILRPNTNGWDRREQPVRSELSERQYREARETIALETTGLFFDAYASRVALVNATGNAAVNDTLYTLNKGRFEVGKIGENDLLQSELALLRARNAADAARLDYDRALASLRLAIGLPPGSPIEISVSGEVPTFAADTTMAVAEALRNRAVVTSAELDQVQADRRVTEARLNNGLGATLTASYGFNATGDRFRAAYQALQESRGLSLSVEVPLVQWGVRGQAVQAAKADRDEISSQNRGRLAATAQEAHFAVLQLEQARRNLTLSAKGDTVANRRFEVAYNRYVVGRISVDNLYIAQAEKDQALSGFVQALRGYWLAHYGLRRATLYDFQGNAPIR